MAPTYNFICFLLILTIISIWIIISAKQYCHTAHLHQICYTWSCTACSMGIVLSTKPSSTILIIENCYLVNSGLGSLLDGNLGQHDWRGDVPGPMNWVRGIPRRRSMGPVAGSVPLGSLSKGHLSYSCGLLQRLSQSQLILFPHLQISIQK